MDNRAIIRAIDNVLDNWAKLDNEHRGSLYGNAVASLTSWKKKLEETT